VARRKPAPDVFLAAARRIGASPAGCVVVEDSTSGLRAARAAGMRAVLLQDPAYPEVSQGDASLVVDRLADLGTEVLRRLVASR